MDATYRGNDRSNGSSNGNGHRYPFAHDHDDLIEVAERIATHEFDAVDSNAAIEDAVKLILLNVGENPDRDGLQRTPHRVAKMYAEMLEGYTQDVETIINGALFEVEYGEGEMIVVADIDYSSMCEHHMLPFTGKAHIAYIPRDKIVGLSKIPRIVDMFARRLQVQERLTNEVADALNDTLDPLGVMVVFEGHHSCAALRGVKKHDVNMVTTARRGAFRTEVALRDEFFRLAGIS